MLTERIVSFSDTDAHGMFRMLGVSYPPEKSGKQPYSEHRHSQMEISAIVSGSGVYSCAGMDYAFVPGDVFFHCGNDEHIFRRIDPGESLSLLVLQFEPRLIWSLGSEWIDTGCLAVFTGTSRVRRCVPHGSDCARHIAALLKSCAEECRRRDAAYATAVKARLLEMLVHLVRCFGDELARDVPPMRSQHIGHIEASMDYIHAHLEERLSLDDLARVAQMSRSHYAAIFKALNGISVGTYIVIRRVNRAQTLLEETDMPITEISGACGFNSLANFNRMFKKSTGKTPSEFRRREDRV